MTSFPFIQNAILQKNLDIAEQHIIDLTLLSESTQYKRRSLLLSSLRKTIIILTASTIEALLLWKLKQVCQSKNIEMDDEWKYFDLTILHRINSSEEVIAGKRKKEKKEVDRLDFVRIIDLSVKHHIIRSVKQESDLDRVRGLRNRLHIGSLTNIETGYKKTDLEFCFKVSRKVKDFVSK